MYKFQTPDDVDNFLKSLHLTVGREMVDAVIKVLEGNTEDWPSLYAIHHGKTLPSGERLPSLCGKGTAYKIKHLFDEGILDPYMDWSRGDQGSQHETDDQPEAAERSDQRTGEPPGQVGNLDSLLITVQGTMHGRRSALPPLIADTNLVADTYFWVVLVRLESISKEVISVGDFLLEVCRDEIGHDLPHLGSDVYGSRAGVPIPQIPIGTHVALTPTNPVLIGALRFIDDRPFDAGSVTVRLLIKGTGLLKDAEKMHDLGSFDLRASFDRQ